MHQLKLFTHLQRIWCENIVSSSQRSHSFGSHIIALCITCYSLVSPSLHLRCLFPRSLIGNWSCLTGSDSLCCCCALSVVMWRSVFIANLHKSLWGNERPGTWSSLIAQSVLGDDQCGEMIRGGMGPTLEQSGLCMKLLLQTITCLICCKKNGIFFWSPLFTQKNRRSWWHPSHRPMSGYLYQQQ